MLLITFYDWLAYHSNKTTGTQSHLNWLAGGPIIPIATNDAPCEAVEHAVRDYRCDGESIYACDSHLFFCFSSIGPPSLRI